MGAHEDFADAPEDMPGVIDDLHAVLREVWRHGNMTPLSNGLMERIADLIGEDVGA